MRFELTATQFGSDNIATLASIHSIKSTHICADVWKLLARRLRETPAILNSCAAKDIIALSNYRLRSIDKSYIAPSAGNDGRCDVVYIVIFG